jgi:hypothetical protein
MDDQYIMKFHILNQDLKIFGANLLSKNVNLNIGNNLLLKSRQNLLESDSYNIGMSFGISGDSSGVSGGCWTSFVRYET